MHAFERFFAGAAALLLLTGCSRDGELVGDAAGAVVVANGVHLNGLHLNGLHLNGLHLNGLHLNGTQLDGIRLDDLWLDHSYLNGQHLDDVTLVAGMLAGVRPSGGPASGTDLTGALIQAALSDGTAVTLRLDSVTLGPPAPRYAVSISATGGPFHPLCGDETGVPVAALALSGLWDETTGAHLDDPARFTFACDGYALAKCVELGYAPWRTASECRGPSDCHDLPLSAFHQACTRMLRADYCGDGTATTRDGTMVDVWDTVGLQTDTEPSWTFEAEWSDDGATCVEHTRWSTLEHDHEGVATYVQQHCPDRWQRAGCGGPSSTFFPASGFATPTPARALLRTRIEASN